METNGVSGRNIKGEPCTDQCTLSGKQKDAVSLSALKGGDNIHKLLTRVDPNLFTIGNVCSKIKACGKTSLIIGINDRGIGFVVV
jgi:hypothetical protein